MMALTHTLVGVGGYAALSGIMPNYIALNAVSLGVVAIGSVFPDIDDPHSWLGRRLWPIAKITSMLTRHRGFTHSLLGAALIIVGMGLIANAGYSLSLVFLFGYLSHLFADFFSNSGVPLLWPSKSRFCFPYALQTGGFTEYLLSIILAAMVLYGLWIHFVDTYVSL